MRAWLKPAAAPLCATIIAVVAAPLCCAVEAGEEDDSPRPQTAATGVLDEANRATTVHRLKTAEGVIDYTATTASLTVGGKEEAAAGRIFYIAYTAHNSALEQRPLTFVFNGGPGASSAYLHLGALGPQRLLVNDDGTLPPLPARLEDNALSWLVFSDLVFVDPVGTGYSRALPGAGKTESSEAQATSKGRRRDLPWGVAEDADSLARFIRLYLTRQGRWLSPIYLAGESYGGFRVAHLAQRLQENFGIAPKGLVLISPALEFGLLWGDEHGLLYWAALLPSYAAVANFHGRGAGSQPPGDAPRERLAKVEEFALSDLLGGLARGSKAEGELHGRLAELTGMDEADLDRYRARLPPSRFVKALLSGQRRMVSLYDGSVSLIDPEPSSPRVDGDDPYLLRINAALTSAFNHYVRDRLQFKTDVRYRLLNEEVFESWNWRSGIRGQQGYAGVVAELRKAMSLYPDLRVMIVHGVYDLVTPYFGSVLAVEQMGLDPSIRNNVRIDVYEGGHMPYLRRSARRAMFRDARQFYAP